MPGLARFAASPAGQTYAVTCRHFGLDPGAVFTDDVLAHNLRVALMISAMPEQEATFEEKYG